MEDEEEAYDSVMRKKKRQEGSELSMRYRRKTARCAGCCFSLLKSLKGPGNKGGGGGGGGGRRRMNFWRHRILLLK